MKPNSKRTLPSEEDGASRFTHHLLLVCIVLVAGVLRWWGSWFGLPHTECRPDETIFVQLVWRFGSGDLHPHQFDHPTLYPYLLFGMHGLYFLTRLLSGRFTGTADFINEIARDPSVSYFLARFISVLLGTATVLVVYALGRRLSHHGKGIAWLASLFLALAYLHVRDSHFGKDDVALAFFLTGALLYVLKSADDQQLRSYALAGVFAGLATATKYLGIVVIPLFYLARWFNVGRPLTPRILLDVRPLAALAALLLAFVVGVPYALLDYRKFFSDVFGQMRHQGPAGFSGDGWWFHPAVSLWYGMGWSLFLASLGGIVLLLKRREEQGLLLCAFVAVYYAAIGPWEKTFVRYAIPLIPALCTTAAVWIVWASEQLGRLIPRPLRRALPAALALVVIAPSATRAIQCNVLLAREDNRLVVARWITEHVPPGSSICQVGTRPGKLQLPQTLEAMEHDYAWAKERGRGVLAKVRFERQKTQGIQGYQESPYSGPGQALPDYFLVQRYPLNRFALAQIPSELPGMLEESYALVKSFEVLPMNDSRYVFDDNDGFYLPFAGFWNVQRAGPNFYLYEHRSHVPQGR